jgi:hypothetical protein
MTAQWGRFQLLLTAGGHHEDPVSGVPLTVEFRHESGEVQSVRGFWNGQSDWIARFSPSLVGQWSWRSHCPVDEGLDGVTGSLQCVAGPTDNPLYRHGPIRTRGSHFEHADGTPFFWLGDTAWNGPLKSDAEAWREYLADRKAKGFNVIQFVITQWIAAAGDREGRRAYNGVEPLAIDPVFFQRLDAYLDAINEFGMVAAPVLAWAATWHRGALDLNPGTSLSDSQLVALARYIVARYGAHHAAWILAGDGDYRGDAAERWRRIGRAVFENEERLATMHPGGKIWIADEFADEPWFRFNGYQSGHWREESEQWLREGPPCDWQRTPHLPHVNLEFCYEAHEDFIHRRPFDAADIRRAAWTSVLAAPPAGVTYGCQGVWSWESQPVRPMNHANTGIARPWREAMHFPGSTGMKHLKDLLAGVEWWRLKPWPEFAPAARSEAGDFAIAYLEGGGAFCPAGMEARYFDPATGNPAAEGDGERVVILHRSKS